MATLRLPTEVAAKLKLPPMLAKPVAQPVAKPPKPPKPAAKAAGKKAKAVPDKPRKIQKTKAELAAIIAEEHAAAVRRRKRRRGKMQVILAQHYPVIFGDRTNPKPLARGIDKALRAAHGWSSREATMVLGCWTSRDQYLRAVLAGGPRYNLDGSEAEEGVTESQIEAARAVLENKAPA